jgi:hypothetical protein
MPRRALRLLGLAASVPPLASLLVALSVPPLASALPRPIASGVTALSRPIFRAIASLPPDSWVGRAFYGSYDALVPLFGPAALAAHAILLSLPFVALAALCFASARRAAAARTPR